MTCLDALSLSFKSIISPVIVFRMVKGRGDLRFSRMGGADIQKNRKFCGAFFRLTKLIF